TTGGLPRTSDLASRIDPRIELAARAASARRPWPFRSPFQPGVELETAGSRFIPTLRPWGLRSAGSKVRTAVHCQAAKGESSRPPTRPPSASRRRAGDGRGHRGSPVGGPSCFPFDQMVVLVDEKALRIDDQMEAEMPQTTSNAF